MDCDACVTFRGGCRSAILCPFLDDVPEEKPIAYIVVENGEAIPIYDIDELLDR